MLSEHYQAGMAEAMARFGVKEAAMPSFLQGFGGKALNFGKGLGRSLVGHPDQVFKEMRGPGGWKTPFRDGGMLSAKNVFWPEVPKAGVRPLADASGMRLTNAMGGHAAGTRITDDVAKSLKGLGHHEIHATPGFGHKLNPWMGRIFGTALPAYGVLQAARGKAGDPNESRLTNTLSAAGGALGAAYGFPALGMLGAPYLAQAGSALGKGVGHMVGGPSIYQQQQQQQQQAPAGYPPQRQYDYYSHPGGPVYAA